MSALEEIEAIRQLKYRYLRAVDLKMWDLLESTFAEDAVCAYDGGKNSYEGREAIVGWLRNALDNAMITCHHAHHPEIELIGPHDARGIWHLEDRVINPGPDMAEFPGHSTLIGAAFYADEYVKIDGEWKISRTGYERTFMEIRPYEATKKLYSRWQDRT